MESFAAPAHRVETAQFYRRAVDRVIVAMQEHLGDPFTLADMADVALISPFHFNRVFREMAGVSPCRYLGSLRLEAAKRLLLTTQLSVTEICYEVGYNSLGTFMRRFKELVGLSPRQFRIRARRDPLARLEAVGGQRARNGGAPPRAALEGCVSAPEDFAGTVFVGLFPTPVPQGLPAACTVLAGAGPFHVPRLPDGRYYLFAAGLRDGDDPTHALLGEGVLRGTARERPIEVCGGRAVRNGEVVLRGTDPLDPPILPALPLLLEPPAPEEAPLHN